MSAICPMQSNPALFSLPGAEKENVPLLRWRNAGDNEKTANVSFLPVCNGLAFFALLLRRH
jgi:hypothetical protein